MLDTLKKLLANQYEAALCTLNTCIEKCPDSHWDMRIGIYPFSQVAFHTLFFADYYLEPNETSFRDQAFHRENAEFFGDYEQLEWREPVCVYDRPSLQKYVQHVRHKAVQTIASETADSLSAKADFERRDFSRAELHVYSTRHLQHHAAQLILRLRIESDVDIPWFGSGWKEV